MTQKGFLNDSEAVEEPASEAVRRALEIGAALSYEPGDFVGRSGIGFGDAPAVEFPEMFNENSLPVPAMLDGKRVAFLTETAGTSDVPMEGGVWLGDGVPWIYGVWAAQIEALDALIAAVAAEWEHYASDRVPNLDNTAIPEAVQRALEKVDETERAWRDHSRRWKFSAGRKAKKVRRFGL